MGIKSYDIQCKVFEHSRLDFKNVVLAVTVGMETGLESAKYFQEYRGWVVLSNWANFVRHASLGLVFSQILHKYSAAGHAATT